jgi:hypothetical protein
MCRPLVVSPVFSATGSIHAAARRDHAKHLSGLLEVRPFTEKQTELVQNFAARYLARKAGQSPAEVWVPFGPEAEIVGGAAKMISVS